MPDLEKEDFTILDNGKPQEITFFQNDVQPFTVVVMLDFSASMTTNLKLLKSAAEQFILRMLPEDKAQVGAFSDKIMFSGTFTSDRDDLIGALRRSAVRQPDAALRRDRQQHRRCWTKRAGRKVVLVFTDGDDTASRRSFGDVLEQAREKEVMIYAIGLRVRVLQRPADAAHAPDTGAAPAGRRDRRRVLRAEEDRRTGADVHPRRRRSCTASTRSASRRRTWTARNTAWKCGSSSRDDGARPPQATSRQRDRCRGHRTERSDRCSRNRNSGSRPTRRSKRCSARCCRWPTTEGFEVELQNGVLQVIFEEPRPPSSSSARTRRCGRSGCRRCRAASSWRGRTSDRRSPSTARSLDDLVLNG